MTQGVATEQESRYLVSVQLEGVFTNATFEDIGLLHRRRLSARDQGGTSLRGAWPGHRTTDSTIVARHGN